MIVRIRNNRALPAVFIADDAEHQMRRLKVPFPESGPYGIGHCVSSLYQPHDIVSILSLTHREDFAIVFVQKGKFL